jgi:hypothetical protein
MLWIHSSTISAKMVSLRRGDETFTTAAVSDVVDLETFPRSRKLKAIADSRDTGANILYHRNTIGGHNQELFTGRLRALDYLSDILDGTSRISKPASGCRTVNVTRAVNITLQGTTAREGQLSYPYTAVILTNIDVKAAGWKVYPNGSYKAPGSALVNPYRRSESYAITEGEALSSHRQSEPESIATVAKRWTNPIITTILNKIRADIPFLSAIEHRLDTVAASPYWSEEFHGIV